MKLRHYGSSSFSQKLWTSIRNRPNSTINKPYGRFWCCPINSKKSWYNWCIKEDYRVCTLQNQFDFEITKEARILKIASMKKLISITKKYGLTDLNNSILFMGFVLNFELLSQDYDMIHLTANGERVTRNCDVDYPVCLYGWDCESVLILNQKIISL